MKYSIKRMGIRRARPCSLCERKRTVQRIVYLEDPIEFVAWRIDLCGVCCLDLARQILEGWVRKKREPKEAT